MVEEEVKHNTVKVLLGDHLKNLKSGSSVGQKSNIFLLVFRSTLQVVADFGCGEAIIAQSVANKVHSFDLVAKNKFVTACNMAKVC